MEVEILGEHLGSEGCLSLHRCLSYPLKCYKGEEDVEVRYTQV